MWKNILPSKKATLKIISQTVNIRLALRSLGEAGDVEKYLADQEL